MTPRILLITEVFPPQNGGSGRWMWELYRRLDGVVVHVAAATVPGAAAFDATSALPIERLPLRFSNWGLWDPRGGWQYLRTLPRLLSLVSSVRPDVIHCGKCLPEGLLALGLKHLRGLPFYCYAHGEELTLARTSRELRQLTARVLRAAILVIANSQFTKSVLVGDWGVSPTKTVVLHPGVDTTRFVPAESAPAVREQLGWAGRRVILTVGALQKRKGQDMLIRALPAILAEFPNVLYSIAGEGWERPYLERIVADLGVTGAVQFRGTPPDDELVQCYQQCDVFALPNRRVDWDVEGFGIALLEAQACGRPVIAGRSGGTADTLDPGVTGELVPCESPEPIAEAARTLLADPARSRRMGDQARQWAVDRFDWGALSRQAGGLFRGSPGPRLSEVAR